jgi:hypothetical protein
MPCEQRKTDPALYSMAAHINELHKIYLGARGGVVIKALRYKPAGRGFVPRWCHWNFSVT